MESRNKITFDQIASAFGKESEEIKAEHFIEDSFK